MTFGQTIGNSTDEFKAIRQCWQTPRELFDQLNKTFNFTVDACASNDNALLPRYWSADNDCTNQDWKKEIVFCNPPFGIIAKILPKAAEAKTALFLLPLTCLTTKYFALTKPAYVCMPAYRIKFTPPKGLPLKSKEYHPSLGTVILLFGNINKSHLKTLHSLAIQPFQLI